ncbi:MAG: hypothetical protein GF370_02800 [Candidatus Nealsonbacteria bacterium]|nr:hypothetical protein [Candidatus Nealsonbacteria bacterium]
MKKILLNKNWRVIKRKDRICLLNLVTSKQLEITEDKDITLYLFDGLKEKISQEALFRLLKSRFPRINNEWLEKALEDLKEYGVIRSPRTRPSSLPKPYLIGLDRQLDFLEETFPEEGKYKKQTELKETKIAFLGLGIISQYIILPLIASGVGKFKCIDFDIVEKRNIGRQPMFRDEDIGKSKSKVVKDFIENSRFATEVESANKMIKSPKDVKDFVEGCNIVLHCCDYPRFTIHRWINQACLEIGMPNLLVYSGRVGPFSIPYETSCYGCLETFLGRHVVSYKEFTKIIKEEGFGRYPELAVVAGMTGVLAAKEIIGYILGITPETYNAFFDINPFTLKVKKHSLPREKKCYACGEK